jgi:hypothetical protein
MKFYETTKQYIILEENMSAPEWATVYSIGLTSNMDVRYRLEFPEYDLIISSRGGPDWSSHWFVNYKCVSFTPKYTGDWDLFIIGLLNKLKSGENIQILMEDLIERSLTKDHFKIIRPIIQSNSIRLESLEKEIKALKVQISELEYLRGLKEENSLLKKKIDEIKEIIK